jgi:hypothetical protein
MNPAELSSSFLVFDLDLELLFEVFFDLLSLFAACCMNFSKIITFSQDNQQQKNTKLPNENS